MISLRVLGPLDLRRNDQPVHTLLAQPKRMALLAYVSASGGGSDEYVRRDAITSLFWPERSNERARAALRTALHTVRTALGDVIESRGNDELRIVRDRLWCDVSAFARAYAGGEWTHALELYRGDFLGGLHGQDSVELDRWIEEQRSRYRAMARTAALRCCDAEERRGDFAAALELARRALSLAGPDEISLRRVMRLHDALGDRAGALAAFEAFSASLRLELDVEPDRETIDLAKALRDGRQVGPAPPAPPTPPTGARANAGETRHRHSPAVTVIAIALLAAGVWTLRRADDGVRAAPPSGQVAELAAGVRGYLQITGMPSPLSHMAAAYDAIHDKVYMVAGSTGVPRPTKCGSSIGREAPSRPAGRASTHPVPILGRASVRLRSTIRRPTV